MRNSEALLKLADTMEWVERNRPELYDQGTFGNYEECGTSACIAGWQAAITGYKPTLINFSHMDRPDFTYTSVSKLPLQTCGADTAVDVAQLAQGQLGLDTQTADDLFDEYWNPSGTVAQTLRALADGADLYDYTDHGFE